MNDIAEVSACFIFWRECVRRLKMNPDSFLFQTMAMKAQAQLVLVQARYWNHR